MHRSVLASGLIVAVALTAVAARTRLTAAQDGKDKGPAQAKDASQDKGPDQGQKAADGKKPLVGKALLAQTRPVVKKWKMDDLAAKVEAGLSGRSFERGKKLYSEVKCVLCHTYGPEEGGFIGPSLTDVGARFGAVDVLTAVLEPSKLIADAYQQQIVELEDGRLVTGLVVHLDDEVQITPDTLDPARKITVSTDKIKSMTPSAVSTMPEGLIDTLNTDEILDLIAFVIARNDPEAEMFAAPEKKK